MTERVGRHVPRAFHCKCSGDSGLNGYNGFTGFYRCIHGPDSHRPSPCQLASGYRLPLTRSTRSTRLSIIITRDYKGTGLERVLGFPRCRYLLGAGTTPFPASLPEKGSAADPQSRPANLDLAGPQFRNLIQSAANGLLRRWHTVPKRLSKRWNRFYTAPRDQHPLGATLSFTGARCVPGYPIGPCGRSWRIYS